MNIDSLVQDFSKKEKEEYQSWNEQEVESFRKIIIELKVNCPLDDIFLLSFLRARKFDRDRAVKLLKNYLSSRLKYQDIFKEYNPSSVKKYLDMKIVGYFPHTDEEGRIWGIGRCDHWDPSKVDIKVILKMFLMFLDMGLTGHVIQVNGFVMVLDANTLSWSHIFQLTPTTVFTVVSLIFGCTPISFKQIHVINIGKSVSAFYTLFKPFISYKIRKRIHFHTSGMESLHKFIKPQHLPVEYGGELPPFDPTECNENLMKYQEYFENNQQYYSSK